MVNLSFEQGVFPDELKIAVITPLYKAKDPMFFNNYRHIPLLSVFSKIFERLMYNRILNFVNRHKLFNKFQFGFRNNHSTFMALIILIENLVNALDNGNVQWVYFCTSRKRLILWITAFYLINCIVMVYVVLRINGSSATCPIVSNQLCIMDMNLNSK